MIAVLKDSQVLKIILSKIAAMAWNTEVGSPALQFSQKAISGVCGTLTNVLHSGDSRSVASCPAAKPSSHSMLLNVQSVQLGFSLPSKYLSYRLKKYACVTTISEYRNHHLTLHFCKSHVSFAHAHLTWYFSVSSVFRSLPNPRTH